MVNAFSPLDYVLHNWLIVRERGGSKVPGRDLSQSHTHTATKLKHTLGYRVLCLLFPLQSVESLFFRRSSISSRLWSLKGAIGRSRLNGRIVPTPLPRQFRRIPNVRVLKGTTSFADRPTGLMQRLRRGKRLSISPRFHCLLNENTST